MKKSINESIKCALALVIATTLTFIVVMIVFMGCFPTEQGKPRPIYDALYIGGTFFGGFATLTAAYIASRMFNDWKDQHNKTIYSDFAIKNISMLQELIISLNKHISIKNDVKFFLDRFPLIDLNNSHIKDNFNLISELYDRQLIQTKEKLNNYKTSSELILLTIGAKEEELQHINEINNKIELILEVNSKIFIDNIFCREYLNAIITECENLNTILNSKIHINIIKTLTPYIKA